MSLNSLTKFLEDIKENYSHSETITEKENEHKSAYLIRGLSEDEAFEIALKFITDKFESSQQFQIKLDFGDKDRKFDLAYYDETITSD